MENIRGNYFIKNDEIMSRTYFDPYLLQEGQSIYEVFRIISGIPLFLEKHLERLEQSAARTNHILKLTRQEISERIKSLIKACRIETGNIKIVIHYSVNLSNSVEVFFAYFIEHHYPSDELYAAGIETITYHAERKNPNAKVANIELNSLVNQAIKQNNVYEALLLDRNGCLTEGSRSNIFMIKDNTIYTAPLNNVLPGITRGYIFEICDRLAFNLIEANLKEDQLADMDALFLTGTSPNVLAIKKVNQFTFNSAAHPMVRAIMNEYNSLIKHYLADHQN